MLNIQQNKEHRLTDKYLLSTVSQKAKPVSISISLYGKNRWPA